MHVYSDGDIDIDEKLNMFVEFYKKKMFKKSLCLNE